MLETLRSRLADDPEASTMMAHFEQNPNRYQPVMEEILKEKLSRDPSFLAELVSLVEHLGPDLEVIQKVKFGRGVTGIDADEMATGHAKVHQEIDQAEDLTGMRIKRLGLRLGPSVSTCDAFCSQYA